jgi:PAS domain S-box-containing protein
MRDGSISEENASVESPQRQIAPHNAVRHEFNDLAHLAAHVCGSPTALIVLKNGGQEHLLASIGLPASQAEHYLSICLQIATKSEPLFVPDLSKDGQFAGHPLVISQPHLRFYACAPLTGVQGEELGFICVFDSMARWLEDAQLEALQRLARQADALFRADLATGWPLLGETNELVQVEEAIKGSQRFLQATLDALTTHIAVLDESGKIIAANRAWEEFVEGDRGTVTSCGVGCNYLSCCEVVQGAWANAALETTRGIREVIEGRSDSFYQEFPDSNAADARWFSVRVTRFPIDSSTRLVVAHDDITERKQAEVSVRINEANLSKAQQIAGVGSWEMDLIDPHEATSNPLRWSDEMFRIFGTTPGAVVPSHESFFTFVHPEDKPILEQTLLTAIWERRPCNVEHRIILSDGTIRFVHGESELVFDAAGQPVKLIGTLQDITERKETEAALRESEMRYRALAEAAPDDIFIIDSEGLLQYINHHAAQMFGTSPEALLGKSQAELYPAPVSSRLKQATDEVIRSGEASYQELVLPYPGKDIWHSTWLVPVRNSEGKVTEVMGVARDISGQKQAEATLRASEERYRSLFESNPHPMWVFEHRTLKFLAVNDAAINHYGYKREEFLSMTIEDIRPPDDITALRGLISEPPTTKIKQGTWRHRKKDGSSISVEVSTHQVRFEDKIAYLTLAHDVTERLGIERALHQTKNELEQRVEERTAELAKAVESMRIENIQHQMTLGTLRQAAEALQHAKEEADEANMAKSQFLSRMSHELRTPLNAILGFGQILQNQKLTSLGEESVGYILKGGNHLLNLINEILDIARLESGSPNLSLEPVELSSAIPEVCAMVRPLADSRGITLVENTAEVKGRYILADLQRLKQVLINLLANAIKYNRQGGKAEVICSQSGNGHMSIAVRDTGIGIAPEDIPKLFTAFERLGATTSEIEGTGLGLVLSQRLVTAMNGTVEVESTLGEGTTLTLRFPDAIPLEEQLAASSEEIESTSPTSEAVRNRVVLCIEDNPSNLRLIEVILHGRSDITLQSALTGLAGLAMARELHPDIILLDLNLPDIDGKDVLERLQESESTRHIPVIVVSADATPKRVDQLLALGAREYLTKPLNVGHFLRTLDNYLPEAESGKET